MFVMSNCCVVEGEEAKMEYLVVKLFWYLVIAFVIGVFVGWVSCGPSKDDGR